MEAAQSLKSKACDEIDRQALALLDLSHRIHAHPEVRFEEYRASTWLAEYLNGVGFSVGKPAYGLETAVVAALGDGRPRVALLCEYDALPEIGHACGHNVIAAAGAGAAAGLASIASSLPGSLRVLGTPAEEGGGGKAMMAREGAFEDVDVAMMIHPSGVEALELDALAVTALEVVYHGRAAHAAASPHKGINALDALVSAYQAIAQLRQHIPASQRVHGIITDGGQAANIVPEHAAGLFFVRAANRDDLQSLEERVRECFRAGAVATGAELSITTQGEDYDDLVTNEPLAALYAANLSTLGRELSDAGRITGSTDMGNVSHLLPSIHPMIRIASPDVALHTKEFERIAGSEGGDRGVIDGAKALAMTAVDYFSDESLQQAVRVAFETRAL